MFLVDGVFEAIKTWYKNKTLKVIDCSDSTFSESVLEMTRSCDLVPSCSLYGCVKGFVKHLASNTLEDTEYSLKRLWHLAKALKSYLKNHMMHCYH